MLSQIYEQNWVFGFIISNVNIMTEWVRGNIRAVKTVRYVQKFVQNISSLLNNL